MVSELVNLRLPAPLLKDIRKYSAKRGYKNVQEYIREALREKTTKEIFADLKGAFPKAKPLTQKDREEAVKNLFAERGWDYDAFSKPTKHI